MDHHGLRLYVLDRDESIRWERRFGEIEQTTALRAFGEAIQLFPGRVIVLCDLKRNRVICTHDPARDCVPA
jgi:hypothetical protein